MSIKKLNMYLSGEHAGTVTQTESGNLEFNYNPDYRGVNVSLAFPKQNTTIPHRKIYPWLAGLLPDEREIRKSMAYGLGIKPDSIFALTREYGLDLPGAVQLTPSDHVEENGQYSLVPISTNRIGEELNKAYQKRVWIPLGGSWSLAGAQTKIALRRNPDGTWAYCQGDAPTNVIVKPGIGGYKYQALDEHVTMRLAHKAGLLVAQTSMQRFGDIDAIVIDRYDRVPQSDGTIARIHQEDMCQALSILPDHKYAPTGPIAQDIIDVLKHDGSGDSSYRFLDAHIFNYLVGATDAHGKNYSIILEKNGGFLAPLYDVASHLPYLEEYRQAEQGKKTPLKSAMPFGKNYYIGTLSYRDVTRFCQQTGFSIDLVYERIDTLADKISTEMPRVLDECSNIEGIDYIASHLTPRLEALCEHTVKHARNKYGEELDLFSISPSISKVDSHPLETCSTINAGEVWVEPHERNGHPVKGHWRKRPNG